MEMGYHYLAGLIETLKRARVKGDGKSNRKAYTRTLCELPLKLDYL